jgi:hypothetical protein
MTDNAAGPADSGGASAAKPEPLPQEEPAEEPLPEPRDVSDSCDCELEKIRYQAQVDRLIARDSADLELRKLQFDTGFALQKGFHDALAEIAKGSIARVQAGAEAVRTASAAIGVIYAGALGLAFSVTDRPLPLRGAIPAFFLGLSIAMATAFLAIPTRPPEDQDWPEEAGGFVENARERTGVFIRYVGGLVAHKAYQLKAAVISLMIGVVFLPVGFITFGTQPSPPVRVHPAWPSPSGAPEANLELQKILFQAQVQEIAEQRAAAAEVKQVEQTNSPGILTVYGLALAGFIWVLAVFFDWKLSDEGSHDSAGPPGGGSD